MSTKYPCESALFSQTVKFCRYALLPAILLLVTSCGTVPEKQAETVPEEAAKEIATEEDIVRIEPVRPKIPLSEEILYKTLVAEFAGQRSRLDVAVEN
jgi:hypothetical protein